jgi:hypothetical protein
MLIIRERLYAHPVYLSFSKCAEQLWGLLNHLLKGYQALLHYQSGHGDDQSPPSSDVVKNERTTPSLPHTPSWHAQRQLYGHNGLNSHASTVIEQLYYI